jgi:serine/threonine protein kinase
MAPIEQLTVVDDRYEIVGTLDTGGTGVVHRAVDRRLGRTVAIKVVHTTDARMAERAAREARLLALVDHPNVVRVYDAGIHAGSPYVVTELVPGRPLSRLVALGPMPVARVAAIGHGAAAGLAASHGAGIVHRDLKPANILVSDRGVVRLLDYGVASVADLETISIDGEVVGTPRYLAPEQLLGEQAGPPVDIYALGLVLIECLAGRHPFGGTVVESVGARLASDPPLPPGVGPMWAELLATMTARQPSARPTAEEVRDVLAPSAMAADLRPLASAGDDTVAWAPSEPTLETAVLPAPASVPGRPSSLRPRRRWWVAVLAFVVLVAAASAAGAWRLADRPTNGVDPSSTATTEAPAPTTTSTSAPPTTVRPTTTTRPPTTTTTPTTTKGRGKAGKDGRPKE